MTNLKSFDLNLLRVLNALLEDHSTVRAGERLGLSQLAVLAALGRLRTSLGDELFFRRGKALEPTQYALTMKEDLQEILDRTEALIQGPVEFDPATSGARFRISGSDFFAELLMPRLAERFQAIAPAMRVHLVDLFPDSFVETLDRYEVDLALVPNTTFTDWVESQPVFRSGFSVIARQDHPRLKREGLSSDDIVPIDLFCDIGYVLFSPEGNSTAMGDAALAKVGCERRVIMTMPIFFGCLSCRGCIRPHCSAPDCIGPSRCRAGRAECLPRADASPYGAIVHDLAPALLRDHLTLVVA